MARLYGDISSALEIRNYFYRRCSRILPAYYVVILFVVVIAIALLLPHEISMVMKQSLWSAFLLPSFGFWQDSAYFDYTLFRPLLNLWSLGVELQLQFYLLFPLLLVVERCSSRLLFLLVFISFLEYGLLSFVDPTSAFFLLPGRIWEFMAGYYASRYALGISARRERSGGVLLLGLLIILLVAPACDIQNTFMMSCIVVLLNLSGAFSCYRVLELYAL